MSVSSTCHLLVEKRKESNRMAVMDVRGTYSSNPLNVSLETFAGLGGP